MLLCNLMENTVQISELESRVNNLLFREDQKELVYLEVTKKLKESEAQRLSLEQELAELRQKLEKAPADKDVPKTSLSDSEAGVSVPKLGVSSSQEILPGGQSQPLHLTTVAENDSPRADLLPSHGQTPDTEKFTLLSNLSTANRNLRTLKNHLLSTKTENRSLAMALSTCQGYLQNAQQHLNVTQAEKNNMLTELYSCHATITKLQEKLQEDQEEKNSLSKGLSSLQSEMDILRAHLYVTKENMNVMDKELESTKSENVSISTEIESLTTKLAKSSQFQRQALEAMEYMAAKLNTSQGELENLQTKKKSLTPMLSTTRVNLAQIQQQLETTISQNRSISAELPTSLASNYQELQKALAENAAAENAMAAFKKTIARQEKEVKQLKFDLISAEQTNQQRFMDIGALNMDVERLKEQLATSQQAMLELKSRSNTANARRHQLQEQLKVENTKFGKIERCHQQRIKNMQALLDEISNVKEDMMDGESMHTQIAGDLVTDNKPEMPHSKPEGSSTGGYGQIMANPFQFI